MKIKILSAAAFLFTAGFASAEIKIDADICTSGESVVVASGEEYIIDQPITKLCSLTLEQGAKLRFERRLIIHAEHYQDSTGLDPMRQTTKERKIIYNHSCATDTRQVLMVKTLIKKSDSTAFENLREQPMTLDEYQSCSKLARPVVLISGGRKQFLNSHKFVTATSER